MQIKSIFVNLPVKDLHISRVFWSALGFEFNEQFSDENALCLVLNDGSIHAMLLREDFFATFTHKPVSDRSSSQVLLAIQVDSRDQVDHLVQSALLHGGNRYREATDHGWMYYDSFTDPDGHQWEVMYTAPTLISPS